LKKVAKLNADKKAAYDKELARLAGAGLGGLLNSASGLLDSTSGLLDNLSGDSGIMDSAADFLTVCRTMMISRICSRLWVQPGKHWTRQSRSAIY